MLTETIQQFLHWVKPVGTSRRVGPQNNKSYNISKITNFSKEDKDFIE